MYSNELVCLILEYIDDNLMTKLTIDDIANSLFYNRTYIMKLFKKEIKITIFDYINKIKIEQSIKQIQNYPNEKLIKIAYNNGFYSLEYFSEIFKKEVGVSPRVFKNVILNIDDLTLDEREAMLKNILALKLLKERIYLYKTNKKPKNTKVKVMSIFRQRELT